MNWETYKDTFSKNAYNEGFKEEEITALLNYAEVLFSKNLPVIYEIDHLSRLVGYNKSYIIRSILHTKYFYRNYEIPKKNGTTRVISEPLPSLKEIQYWILKEILAACQVSKYAKAFVKKRSLKGNARFHIGKRVVLTLDIENFFGSIKTEMVEAIFLDLGYSSTVSNVLSRLCCLNGSLPQGAPTSPALSNLMFYKLDEIIADYVSKNEIRYTRYADDLTFSGSFNPGMVIKFIEGVLKDYRLKLNRTKIRTRRPHQRQEVTGIVVNRKMQAAKEVRREFKKNVYFIKKFGLENHLQHEQIQKENYLSHLIGIGNYIFFINPNETNIKRDVLYLSDLKNLLKINV